MAGKAWLGIQSRPKILGLPLGPYFGRKRRGLAVGNLPSAPSLAEMGLPPELKTGLEPTFCRSLFFTR